MGNTILSKALPEMKINMDNLKKVITASEIFDSLQKTNTKKPASKKKKVKGPKEAVIQEQVEKYLELRGIRFLHIPDLVYRLCAPYSPIKVWEKATISKYLKGVPDLMIFKHEHLIEPNGLPLADNSCLILELKRKNGKARDAQKSWHKGLMVHVPESFEEAKDLIDKWM